MKSDALHHLRRAVSFLVALSVVAQPVLADYNFRVPLEPMVTGGQGGGTLVYTPDSADFGAVPVGATASRTIQVSNSGTAAITVNSIAAGGSGYSATNTCGSYIVAGGQCQIAVTFAPTVSGSATGTVTINSDDIVPVTTLPLTGRGQAGTLSAAGYAFPDPRQVGDELVYQDITVTNIGQARVVVSGVSVVAGAAHFSQSNNCSGEIAAGASCTVRVGFAPAAAGNLSGTIALASDSDESPLGIIVTGEGRNPSGTFEPQSFGEVQVGQTRQKNVRLTNTGVGALAINGLSVSGADYIDVREGTSCGTSLPPGDSCLLAAAFTPTAAGPRAGEAAANTGAGILIATFDGVGRDASATLTIPAFGNVEVGSTESRTAVLTNTGVGPVTLASVGTQGTDFMLGTNSCPGVVLAGASCDIEVKLTPTSAGAKSGTLTVSTTTFSRTATLTGTATQGALTFSPASLPGFANTQVGQSRDSAVLTLTNTGTATATSVAVSASTGFSLQSSTCGASLAPNASCTMTVRFSPTLEQAYTGSLSATAAAPTTGATLAVAGTGVGQQGGASAVDFGSRNVGTTMDLVSTLTNSGVGPLSVTAPTAGSVTGTDFSFVSTTCGSSLAVGDSCTTTVRFSPTSNASRTGVLTVATGAGSKTASLTGTGLQAVLSVSPSNLAAFPSTQVGQTADSVQLTLSNAGNLAASTLSLTAPTGFSIVNSTCGASLAAGANCTFNVRFAPAAAQAYSGAVSFTASAPAVSASLNVSGSGQSQSATLSDIAFGNVAVGSNASLTSTLTNTGVGPLTVTVPTGASVTGTDLSFVSTTCGSTVAVGGTCTVTVKFTPTAPATRTGTLTVATGAGSKVADLSATGQQAVLAFTPSTLSAFPSTQVGQTADSVQVTLSNSGNIAASSLTVTPPTGFSITGSTCGASLNAGSNCAFTVRFAPSAAQAYSGNVTAAATAPSTAPSLAVSGTGVSQSATLSDIAFGNVAVGSNANLTSTLTNTGVGPLSITVPAAGSVTGTDFSFVSTTCGTSLASGSTCSVTVKFTPSAAASRTGSLTVATGAGSKVANLSATGQQAVLAFSPSTLSAFPNTQIGQTADSVQVTLSNSGNIAASTLTLPAPSGYSVVNSSCGATLNAGSNCTFNVRFAPSAAQTYSGSLSASAAAPATAPTLAVTGVGVTQAATLSDVAFGNRTANSTTDLTSTLTNTGVGPLSITVPAAGSVTGTGFSFVSTTCSTSLAAGSTCLVTARFTPTNNSAYSGSLAVVTGAGTKTAALSGQGLQGTGIANPTSLTFSATQVAQTSATQAVTVSNNGNTPLNITGVSISVGSSDYAQSNNCGATLANGSSCTINVSFTPAAAGTRTGTLSMTHDGPGGLTSVSLSGTGQAQSATITDVAFGSRTVPSTTDLTATLTNTGVGPISVTVPTAASVSGADFSFVSTTCTASLAASGTCTVTVRFSPTANASRTGTLSVVTSAGTKTSNLSGTGQQAVLAWAYPGHTPGVNWVDWGNVQVGQSLTSSTFTLSNTGNLTATALALSVPTGWSATSNTCGTTLAAGANCTFTLTFAPSAVQAYSGTLSATTASGISGTPYTVKGVGAAAVLSATTANNTSAGTNLTPYTSSGMHVWFKNTGYGPVTINATPTATGSGVVYVDSANNGYCYNGNVLAAGASCAVYVSWFSPGSYSSTVTAYSTGGNVGVTVTATVTSAVSVSAASFGTVQTGQTADRTVTVTNGASFPSRSMTYSTTAPFSIVANNCGATLAANTSCTMTVRYSPTAAGAASANVTAAFTYYRVQDGAERSDATGSSSATGTMSGTGASPSVTQVTSTTMATNMPPWSSSGRHIYIKNSGYGPVTITGAITNSGNISIWQGAYSPYCTTVGTLQPNDTCAVYVYAHGAAGSYSGTVSIPTSAGTVALATTAGLKGDLTVSSGSFGSVTVGGTVDRTLTVTNSADWTARGVSVSVPAPYSIVSNGCATTLAANSSCNVTVRYTASAVGAQNATATVSGYYNQVVNDSDSGSAGTTFSNTNSLSGTGVAVASASASFSPSTVSTNYSSTLSWTTSNASSVLVSCSAPASYSYSGAAVNSSGTVTTSGTGTGSCTVTPYNSLGVAGNASTANLSVVALPTASVNIVATSLNTGTSTTFTWTAGGGASSASASCSGGGVSYSSSALSGSVSITPTAVGTITCSLTATNAAGQQATASDTATATSPSGPVSAYGGYYYSARLSCTTPYAAALLDVFFDPDGTVRYTTSPSTTNPNQAWYSPLTTGVGSSYWVRATTVSGQAPSGGSAVGTWLSLSSSVRWQYSSGTSLVAMRYGTIRVEISPNSSGSVIQATGDIYMESSREC